MRSKGSTAKGRERESEREREREREREGEGEGEREREGEGVRESERDTLLLYMHTYITLTMHSTLRAFSGPKKPMMMLTSLLLISLRAVSGESEKVDGRTSSILWSHIGSLKN